MLYRASLISTGSLEALAAIEAALPRDGSSEEARVPFPAPVTSPNPTTTPPTRGADR